MFRFTIRALLLLTAIVGLSAGWSIQQRALVTECQRWRTRAEAIADKWRMEGNTVEWTDGAIYFWSSGTGGVQVVRTSPPSPLITETGSFDLRMESRQ